MVAYIREFSIDVCVYLYRKYALHYLEVLTLCRVSEAVVRAMHSRYRSCFSLSLDGGIVFLLSFYSLNAFGFG